jgi:GNAT superfamily N-acetyltransferase
LAIDKDWQGQGLGYSLLQDALLRCHAAAGYIGARILLVHALTDDAKRFYEHFGFRASPIDERMLMLLLTEIHT